VTLLVTVLSLLLLCPSLTAAAPHDNRTPTAWRRLSDAILGRHGSEKQKSFVVGQHGKRLDVTDNKVTTLYGGDLVLRFKISTVDEAIALAEAAKTLDVWAFSGDWADIRIAKHDLPSVLESLPLSLKEGHEPLIEDIDQAVLKSTQPQSGHQRGRGHPFFQDYQPLSVINPWMELMSSMFTTHVRRISVGLSHEGRDIPALRVGVHPTNNDRPAGARKTIIVTGGSHAREWISTSTVNYLAWSLINAYGKDREITRFLEEFDFVLVPTLNPDGYVYSWDTDRLWRKNRQPTNMSSCHGVDLDRSYPYQWNGNNTRTHPCSESFAGEAPFDGVEAKRFAEWARNETEYNNVEIVGFLDLHSYSQQILYPYSYSCAEEPPSIEDLEELGLGLAKAIRVSRKGHAYKVTSACEGNVAFFDNQKTILPRIESSGGSALDWFYHELKVRYAYQIKLRDTGSYGFLLPKESIIPTGEEMLDALLYFGRFMLGEVGMAATAKAQDAELKPLDATEQHTGGDEIPVENNEL
jgi:extracellular matrix protein 14